MRLLLAVIITVCAFGQQLTTNNIAPSAKQGNGTKFQLAGFLTTTSGSLVCTDANGNTTTNSCTVPASVMTGILGLDHGGTGKDLSSINKGYLLAGSSLGNLQMLAPGADGLVLSTDSTQPTGLKWIAVSGGGGISLISTTSPLSGGPITTTGTISCPTCAIAPISLTSNALLLGGGGQTLGPMGSLGTPTTLLHGNASGAPTWSQVNLAADVFGVLPITNGGSGSIYALFVDSSLYDYAAISPAGSLTAATPATVTLNSPPPGINGVSAPASTQYIYLAGTGTPEAVALSTGGTCTVSASVSPCTIKFTPANNHSAGYTIVSATAGIYEALVANPNRSVKSPSYHGAYNTYAPIYVDAGVTIDWFGDTNEQNSGSTVINNLHTGHTLVRTGSSANRLTYVHNMTINGTASAGDGIHITTNSGVILERVWIKNFTNTLANGLYCNQCYWASVINSWLVGNAIGITFDASNDVTIFGSTLNGNTNAGVVFSGGSGTEASGNRFQNNDVEVNGRGIQATDSIRLTVTGNWFESNTLPNYFGSNVTSVTYNSNHHQGPGVQFDTADGVEACTNYFNASNSHLDVTTFASRAYHICDDNMYHSAASPTFPASSQFAGGIVAAGTIAIPYSGTVFNVAFSGTNVSTITATWAGRLVILHFDGATTVVNGSNLKLAGANFVGTADSTLTLVSDNVNYYEVGRSVH